MPPVSLPLTDTPDVRYYSAATTRLQMTIRASKHAVYAPFGSRKRWSNPPADRDLSAAALIVTMSAAALIATKSAAAPIRLFMDSLLADALLIDGHIVGFQQFLFFSSSYNEYSSLPEPDAATVPKEGRSRVRHRHIAQHRDQRSVIAGAGIAEREGQSPMLTLYNAGHSTCSQKTCSQKVRICLAEKELPFKDIRMDIGRAKEHPNARFGPMVPARRLVFMSAESAAASSACRSSAGH